MLVFECLGVSRLYRFSHVRTVWALILERFPKSFLLKTASVVLIISINLGLNFKEKN
nr:hypothetical protein [uncultured bacterium]